MRRLRRFIAIILAVFMALGLYHVDVRADGPDNEPGGENVATQGDPEQAVMGQLVFDTAYDLNGNAIYFKDADEHEFILSVFGKDETDQYVPLNVERDGEDKIVINDIASGTSVRFDLTCPQDCDDYPQLSIDGEEGNFDFTDNEFEWQSYFEDEFWSKACRLEFPLTVSIEELTVDDLTVWEGDYEDRDVWGENAQGEWVVIDHYDGYKTWPEKISVKLEDGAKFSGNPEDVCDDIADWYEIDRDIVHDKMREEFDQPYVNKDGQNVTTWGKGEHEVTYHVFDAEFTYKVIVKEYPIEELIVDNPKVMEGSYEDRDIWRWSEEDQKDICIGTYKGYRATPNYVEVKLTDGRIFKTQESNNYDPWRVRDEVAAALEMDPDRINFGDNSGNQDQQAEPGTVTAWTVGEHDAEFEILNTRVNYKVVVIKNPIASMTQPDVERFEGDLSERRGYDVIGDDGKPHWDESVVWQAYDTYPHNVTVTFNDGTATMTNVDWWDVKDAIEKKYGVELRDWAEGDDQSPDKYFEVGEHPITFHLGGTTVSYKVNVVENPIEEVIVNGFNVIQGDYEDHDNWQWSEEEDRDVIVGTFKAYRTFPDYVEVRLKNGKTFKTDESNDYDVWRVRDAVANELNINPNEMDFGDNGGDQKAVDGVTDWTKGEHDVVFRVLSTECHYTVEVIDNPVESMIQPNMTRYEGDIHERQGYETVDEEGNPYWDESIVYEAYDTYPHELTVTFNDGTEPMTGDWWDIRGFIQEKYDVKISDWVEGDTQSPDGYFKKGTYDLIFHLGASTAAYQLEIVDNPIESIGVEDLVKLEGDTREERNEGVTYQIYDPWPRNVTVNLSEEYAAEYGKESITGDPEYVKDQLAGLLNVDRDDLDFRWETDQSPETKWGKGNHQAEFIILGSRTTYNVSIINNPIASVTVEPKTVFENDVWTDHGWDDGQGGHLDVDWARYDTWPHQVTVTLKNGQGTFTGDPNEFHDDLVKKIGCDYDFRTEDNQKPVKQGDKYVTDWTVGNDYPCTFTLAGVKANYNVSVKYTIIESIEINDDAYVLLNDTYTERGYDTDHGWVDEEWQRYGYGFNELVINFTEQAAAADPEKYGSPVTIPAGDWDEMRQRIADALDIPFADVNFYSWDDQYPDENHMTNWGKGKHTAHVSLSGKETTYDVYVVDPEIKKVEVEKVYVDSEDKGVIGYEDPETHEWIPDGYEDPETHEWIPYDEDDPRAFVGYNFFPRKIVVTFKNGDTIEGDSQDQVRDRVIERLKTKGSIPEDAEFGFHIYVTSDQNPDNEWEIGYHKARLEFANFVAEYDVVITGYMGNYTGLAEDIGQGDGYYYFEDGFFTRITGYIKGTVARIIDRQPVEIAGTNKDWYVEDGEARLYIKTQPSDKTAVYGNAVTFTIDAVGKDVEYQWQYSKDGVTWRDSTIASAATDTLKVYASSSNKGLKYRCVVQSGEDIIESSAGTLNGLSVISAQPKNITASIGDKVTFSISSRASKATYQWQFSTDNGATWKDSGATGNKTKTLSVTVGKANHNMKYRCVAKNGTVIEESKPATLTVNAEITANPTDKTAYYGDSVKFSVTAVGNVASYQWQYSTDGKTWKDSGATGNKTSAITVISASANNNMKYRCIVKSGSRTLYSTAAKLTSKAIIITQPANKTTSVGSKAAFTVKAGGTKLSYQWQYSTDGKTWKNSGASGNKTNTLTVTVSASNKNLKYRCIVKNAGKQEISKTVYAVIK